MEYPTQDQAHAAQQVDRFLTFMARSTLANPSVNKCIADKLKEAVDDLSEEYSTEIDTQFEIEFLNNTIKFLTNYDTKEENT